MKTLAECRIIARSSDPEWVGDELFRVQELAVRGERLGAGLAKLRADVESDGDRKISYWIDEIDELLAAYQSPA